MWNCARKYIVAVFRSFRTLTPLYKQTYVLLCVFRAIAGIGGGGIVSSVWLITSELVDESRKARWSQALSVTWSASAIAGASVHKIPFTGPKLY